MLQRDWAPYDRRRVHRSRTDAGIDQVRPCLPARGATRRRPGRHVDLLPMAKGWKKTAGEGSDQGASAIAQIARAVINATTRSVLFLDLDDVICLNNPYGLKHCD